jgi:hypothetical protein
MIEFFGMGRIAPHQPLKTIENADDFSRPSAGLQRDRADNAVDPRRRSAADQNPDMIRVAVSYHFMLLRVYEDDARAELRGSCRKLFCPSVIRVDSLLKCSAVNPNPDAIGRTR